MARVAALALAGALLRPAGATLGLSTCPCIENVLTHPSTKDAIQAYRSADGTKLVYQPAGTTESYSYPSDFGSGGCKAHDDNKPPSCNGASKPAWCGIPWCYVDAEACTGTTKIASKYFPAVEKLYFSFGTCVNSGSSNSFDKWASDTVDGNRQIVELVESYARGTRHMIEELNTLHDTNQACDMDTLCPCTGCYTNTKWNTKVNFMEVGWRQGQHGTDADKNLAECFATGVQMNYKTVAAKESDPDFERVGYQYFGDQRSGSYAQWPKEEFCSDDYDPRFRPWYATAATGAKDVVIIVDISGSMGTAGRHELAKAAVKTILDTLSWRDFATIILFNDAVPARQVYSDVLKAVTEDERQNMKDWCDKQNWMTGGTNFELPVEKAAQIIRDSIAKGQTTMCQKAIMFLTDGQAAFSEQSFATTKEFADKYDVIFFTYALGDGAEASVMKRLACDNKGVFHPVPDGANLKAIMAEYYEYFAHGQEICSGSFVRYNVASGGGSVFAGCMPMYDRTHATPELLGVSCMDVNLVQDVTAMKAQSGWDHFTCIASDMSKMCRQVDLTECHRQKIRRAISEASVCEANEYNTATSDTACPCTDQSCRDDPDFRDELGYFCDTWVGDDCEDPNLAWGGYTAAGLQQVREKCKHSCGLCPWSSGECGRTDSRECPVIAVPTECRACLGKTSGKDIEGLDMRCPLDAPRNLNPTTQAPCQGDKCASISAATRILGPVLLISMFLPWGVQ